MKSNRSAGGHPNFTREFLGGGRASAGLSLAFVAFAAVAWIESMATGWICSRQDS